MTLLLFKLDQLFILLVPGLGFINSPSEPDLRPEDPFDQVELLCFCYATVAGN
jgi:hypothetical protein